MPGGGLRIGAGVRGADLAADARVRERYPVLARALLSAASGQLRNMASTGGNLLQRTRCVYFTDPGKACNKREPGTGCPAQTGLSRELAVLGTSEHCLATHPGDMAVALAALDAVVHVETADGPREVPLGELHRLPGDAPQHDTTLPRGALITAVELPPPLPLAASTYRKARDRASYAFALVSVAGVLVVADGVVRDVRIALGGVAHKPWRARLAEEALVGQRRRPRRRSARRSTSTSRTPGRPSTTRSRCRWPAGWSSAPCSSSPGATGDGRRQQPGPRRRARQGHRPGAVRRRAPRRRAAARLAGAGHDRRRRGP